MYNITHACPIKHLQKCQRDQSQVIYAHIVRVVCSPLFAVPGLLCTLCNLLEISSIKQVMSSSTAQPGLQHAFSLVVGCLTAKISKIRNKQIVSTHLG